ncbi:MAG: flavodoxin domain-containing protein [Bacillota bacterium]|nr:flavodoxin domain-containing protein [Bacillota bacterium]
MRGIILYQSKYGAAKKYAEWLSAASSFPCMELKQAGAENVRDVDLVILGGGVYASRIAGLSFLKKHMDALKGKKLLVYCTGASPLDEGYVRELSAQNLKGQLEGIPLFYCRGAWEPEKMSVLIRTMLPLLRRGIARKDPADYEVWEAALMSAGDESCDWTDRKYLEPLLEYLNLG